MTASMDTRARARDLELAFEVPGRPTTWQRTASYKGRRLTEAAQREAKRTIALLASAALTSAKLRAVWPDDDKRARFEVFVLGVWPDAQTGDSDRLTSLVMDALEGVLYPKDRATTKQGGEVLVVRGVEPRTLVSVRVRAEGEVSPEALALAEKLGAWPRLSVALWADPKAAPPRRKQSQEG